MTHSTRHVASRQSASPAPKPQCDSTCLALWFGLAFLAIWLWALVAKLIMDGHPSQLWLPLNVCAVVMASVSAVSLIRRIRTKTAGPPADWAGLLTLFGLALCALPNIGELVSEGLPRLLWALFHGPSPVPARGWEASDWWGWAFALAAVLAATWSFKIGLDMSRERDTAKADVAMLKRLLAAAPPSPQTASPLPSAKASSRRGFPPTAAIPVALVGAVCWMLYRSWKDN